MFEKEAKEYAVWFWGASPSVKRAIEQSYQKGAEFGYSKAIVWHFVKDGKYPTHSNRVLVFTDEGVGFGIYGLDNKKWYTYDTGFDVIAWREIELP